MVFDFIPLELYGVFYYYAILFTVIVSFFNLNTGFKKSMAGGLFVLLLTIYIGFRPVSYKYFADMGTYNRFFTFYQMGDEVNVTHDYLFHYFMKFCSGFMTANFFFFICAILYIYPLYVVSKKWFSSYWFYAFLFLVASFSFWGYATNGIRNGIAGSIFLLGISRDKRFYQIFLLIIAISLHKTMLLPAVGFVLANFYNRPKVMIGFWVLCIPISLVLGSSFENFVATLGLFEDDRFKYFTDKLADEDKFSSTGFRWDFLAYSGTAVFAGWYFIVKKDYQDKIYFWLFNTYVFANAFWILVIRANFSNRFAYLSWFMMALVITYPFLKRQIMENQSRAFAKILVVYFLFTYLLNVLLVK